MATPSSKTESEEKNTSPSISKGTSKANSGSKANTNSKSSTSNKSNSNSNGTGKATPASKGSGKAGGKGSSDGKGSGAKEGKVTKKMLKEAEQELYQLLTKKKQLDRSLINTESAIYDFETSYFENSGHDGNIVHGFEGYLNTGRHERRQLHFSDADRIFSQSSATFKKAQEAKIAATLQDSDSDESVAVTTKSAIGRKSMMGSSTGGSTIKHSRSGSSSVKGTKSTKKIKLSI